MNRQVLAEISDIQRIASHKFGRSACGKGYTAKQLRAEFDQKRIPIRPLSGGDMTRTRMDSDPTFKKRFAKAVALGDYIPDDEMIPMIQQEVNNIIRERKELVEGDGVGRTRKQLQYLIDRAFVNTENSICVLLKASYTTCRQRFLEAVNRRLAEGRTDVSSNISASLAIFERREKLYKENTPDVIELIYNGGYPAVVIDTEKGLPASAIEYNLIVTELVKYRCVSRAIRSMPGWLDRKKTALTELQEMFT